MGKKDGYNKLSGHLKIHAGLLVLILALLLPFTSAQANDRSHEPVCKYPADLPANLFSGNGSSIFGWNAEQEKPLNYKPEKKSAPQPTANQNIFPAKRKGLTPKAPEPAPPEYSGIFAGYPPCLKSVHYLPYLVLSPQFPGKSFRSRPPPMF